LTYVDQVAPEGTPKPRPNQTVNEPVRRIEQTVVLQQLGFDCPTAGTTTTSTVGGVAPLCWSSAPGWDSDGTVVNVPLPPAVAVTH